MDVKTRELERRSLAGDPSATEHLLWEQKRQGLFAKEHYVYAIAGFVLAAGGVRVVTFKLPTNFEIHSLRVTSTDRFTVKIEDSIGPWSNMSQSSAHLLNYPLYVPRCLAAGSVISMECTDCSLTANVINIELHGIRTVTKKE